MAQQIAGALGPDEVSLRLRVNGGEISLQVDPRTTVLDLLQERLHLTGTKKGCNHGQCGACTILIDGWRANACLALALVYDGAEITTIEGLADGDALHSLQAAFIARDAFQCGYCTPGQIISAVALLQEGAPTDDAIREGMSGNIWRCGAYPNIVAAIRDVRDGAR
jgi:xanthine dehydrogenase YagT iron-sulfur-binding subunit